MTKQSSRDVIRLFMTKLLLKRIYLRDVPLRTISGVSLSPKNGGADFSAILYILKPPFSPHMAYEAKTLVLRQISMLTKAKRFFLHVH